MATATFDYSKRNWISFVNCSPWSKKAVKDHNVLAGGISKCQVMKARGFDIRYEGKILQDGDDGQPREPVTLDFIRSLRGCCKGEDSLVEGREREHRIEKDRWPR